MSTKRQYQSEYYVEGNTIRKRQTVTTNRSYSQLNTAYQSAARTRLEPVPDRRRTARPDRENKTLVRELPTQNWDVKSLLVIVTAVVVVFFMCISYLKAQETITVMSKRVATLESEIMTLKNENTAAYSRINSSVDLQHVYEVAVGQLGMVHAKDNQVVPYNSRKSNSVRQYSEIPEEIESGYRLSGN